MCQKESSKQAPGEIALTLSPVATCFGKSHRDPLVRQDSNRYAEAAKELEEFLELSPDAPNKEDVKKVIKQFKEKGKSMS